MVPEASAVVSQRQAEDEEGSDDEAEGEEAAAADVTDVRVEFAEATTENDGLDELD